MKPQRLLIFLRLFFYQKKDNELEIRVVGQNIEKAIKLLKREAEKEGLFRELKKRRFYEKPSVKKKTKMREAAKKRAKNARFKSQSGYRSRPTGARPAGTRPAGARPAASTPPSNGPAR